MIELACKDDIQIILGLYHSVIGHNGCTWSEEYPNLETITEDIDTQNLWVCRQDHMIVGAVSVVPENELDDIPDWTKTSGAWKEIARIVVKKEYQGKKIAERMLLELFADLKCKQCGAVHLLVSPNNASAFRLYEKLGFVIKTECDRYGQHWYVCECIL